METDAGKKEKLSNAIGELQKNKDENAAKFEKGIRADEVRKEFEKYKNADLTYKTIQSDVIKLAIAGQTDKATLALRSEVAVKAAADINDAFERMGTLKEKDASQMSAGNTATANTAFIVMIGLILACIIISLGLAMMIISAVMKQLGYDPEYVAQIARKVAVGDFSFDIDSKGKHEHSLIVAMHKMVENMKALVADATILEKAAIDGKLATRADVTKHQGDFKKIVQGVNNTLDAVISPLNVAAEYVDRISKGDIPSIITDSYNGDFNEIKNNLNAVVKMMNDLLAETDKITKAAADGQLDQRANADLFAGGWNKLVVGVNDTITNIVNPLMVTADYVDKVSKGVIPPAITQEYKGQYNIIKNNLNSVVTMMSDLLIETDKLVNATVAGQLATRGDAAKFAGGWSKLVGGVNNLCDAFVGPINVTAEYVDRISKGDIPPKITDTYNGDFNEIKNNLNACIDTMSGLLVETDKLVNAQSLDSWQHAETRRSLQADGASWWAASIICATRLSDRST